MGIDLKVFSEDGPRKFPLVAGSCIYGLLMKKNCVDRIQDPRNPELKASHGSGPTSKLELSKSNTQPGEELANCRYLHDDIVFAQTL